MRATSEVDQTGFSGRLDGGERDDGNCDGLDAAPLNHPRGSNDTIHLSAHQDILFSLGCLELMPSEFSPASQVPPVQSFVVSSSSTSWWCAFLRFHSPLSDSAPFSQVIICTHMASALHLDCQPDLFTIFYTPELLQKQ